MEEEEEEEEKSTWHDAKSSQHCTHLCSFILNEGCPSECMVWSSLATMSLCLYLCLCLPTLKPHCLYGPGSFSSSYSSFPRNNKRPARKKISNAATHHIPTDESPLLSFLFHIHHSGCLLSHLPSLRPCAYPFFTALLTTFPLFGASERESFGLNSILAQCTQAPSFLPSFPYLSISAIRVLSPSFLALSCLYGGDPFSLFLSLFLSFPLFLSLTHTLSPCDVPSVLF